MKTNTVEEIIIQNGLIDVDGQIEDAMKDYENQERHGWYKKLLPKLEAIRDGKLPIDAYINEVKDKIQNM